MARANPSAPLGSWPTVWYAGRADTAGSGCAEGRFWNAGKSGAISCGLCPHRCQIAPGTSGICKVRQNEDGRLVLPFYGRASSVAVDPIEKKPLYHFKPGTPVLSIGFVGCNLRCPFCQNWEISQGLGAPTERLDPEECAKLARRSRCASVAYTYSEPVVHTEWVIEAMSSVRAAGLANVLVTNGCVLPPASTELLASCDAVNVDIKSWDADFYRRELGGELEAVKAFIAEARGSGVHVEATTLVLPGSNDSEEEIDAIAAFLASLSPELPYHLSAYRPMYRWTKPATPPENVVRLAAIARGRLRHVYAGNLAFERNDDHCPACGAVLVRRAGYSVDASGLSGGTESEARCAACGERVAYRL
ncbi:MAG: AmmeMemoRadiSam system radical SAM enzyme [Spirochaetales bacterium]|nr:AmmeMemoRadiSam system radical SAM enzyme [Spirochaetales bacterium]